MTEKQMLEFAAKAAGINLHVWGTKGKENFADLDSGNRWNSLTDDGDALRLAAKLRLDIEHGSPLDNSRYVLVRRCGIEMMRDAVQVFEEFEDESGRIFAMCRAITRAAAAIGEKMP